MLTDTVCLICSRLRTMENTSCQKGTHRDRVAIVHPLSWHQTPTKYSVSIHPIVARVLKRRSPITPHFPTPLCSPLLHIEASHPNKICSEHTGTVERSPYSDSALAKVFSTPVNVAHIGPSVRCSEFNSLYIRYYKYNII